MLRLAPVTSATDPVMSIVVTVRPAQHQNTHRTSSRWPGGGSGSVCAAAAASSRCPSAPSNPACGDLDLDLVDYLVRGRDLATRIAAAVIAEFLT